jgi:hypothetical protein
MRARIDEDAYQVVHSWKRTPGSRLQSARDVQGTDAPALHIYTPVCVQLGILHINLS